MAKQQSITNLYIPMHERILERNARRRDGEEPVLMGGRRQWSKQLTSEDVVRQTGERNFDRILDAHGDALEQCGAELTSSIEGPKCIFWVAGDEKRTLEIDLRRGFSYLVMVRKLVAFATGCPRVTHSQA